MNRLVRYIVLFSSLTFLLSCEMLEPIDENRLSTAYVASDPASAEGLLLHAYNNLITPFSFSEGATDDAVFNQQNNAYKKMATGQLSAQFNPVSRWNNYEQVLYLDKFIDIVDAGTSQWHRDSVVNVLFEQRLKGEALALRALHHFYILQAHAGIGESGRLLGVPYITDFIASDDNFNLPRLSFEATMEHIIKDLDDATALLPYDYSDDPSLVLPRHANIDFSKYKIVNGKQNDLRVSARVVKALKSRIALFAASPAYLDGAGYYEIAATEAAQLISSIGGVAGLARDGVEFYNEDNDKDDGEFIWRGSIGGNSTSLEERHFPPSRNGRGELNPSQNLVDAFPMVSGLPATVANGYDPQNPYDGRDPRLKTYIVVNNSTIGGGVIISGYGGGVDRVDSIPQRSTLTGYYLRKLLRGDVRINDNGSKVGRKHFDPLFRYTELFLILAESANEIGGPDYKVDGISARDVISAIRSRAGLVQPDTYLASINDKAAMRELIRNERRLELCFEGYRFWDLRRWNIALNETVKGSFYDGSQYVSIPAVELRSFPAYARYMPIPNSEIVKFSNLEQNEGW